MVAGLTERDDNGMPKIYIILHNQARMELMAKPVNLIMVQKW